MQEYGHMLSPIALFVYNRPDHTVKTVEALAKNFLASESDLFIFADGPKNEEAKKGVVEVRQYLKTVHGFKTVTIIERQKNHGLAESIIAGVTEMTGKFGKIIVMEDDLVSSPYFLTYMNEALDLYEKDENVISIHGYVYPVRKSLPETFFMRGADCWGWATWKRGWDHFEKDGKKLLQQLEERKVMKTFDMDNSYRFSAMLKKQIAGLNNSWAIRWHASAFVKSKLTLYPGVSLIKNIGHDKTGTHGTQGKFYDTEIANRKIKLEKLPLSENSSARNIIVDYFRSLKPPLWKRIAKKILA